MPVLIILLVIFLCILFASFRIVPQAQEFVIERLGKYRTTWDAGLKLKFPIIDQVVRKVSLKEQVLDFPPQAVITKDNVTMQIDSVVFCRVFDAKAYTYGVENPIVGLQNLAATTLRNIIGEMELDQTLTSRDEINKRLEAILDVATDPWGMKVTRVEIKNIQPPRSLAATMELQAKAERERRQTVLEAQAHQEAVVSRAEGDKRAKILAAEAEKEAQIALAEGKAKSILMVYQAEAEGIAALNKANVSEGVLRLKGLDALKKVADGRATKIYMPSDIASAVSSLGVVGESLGIGDHTPIDRSEPEAKAAAVDPCIHSETSAGGREAASASERINEAITKAGRGDNAALGGVDQVMNFEADDDEQLNR